MKFQLDAETTWYTWKNGKNSINKVSKFALEGLPFQLKYKFENNLYKYN